MTRKHSRKIGTLNGKMATSLAGRRRTPKQHCLMKTGKVMESSVTSCRPSQKQRNRKRRLQHQHMTRMPSRRIGILNGRMATSPVGRKRIPRQLCLTKTGKVTARLAIEQVVVGRAFLFVMAS